jgi:hypothetical protein
VNTGKLYGGVMIDSQIAQLPCHGFGAIDPASDGPQLLSPLGVTATIGSTPSG